MPELELPQRYEPLSELGKGGGGEVWVVRDRHTGARLALKVLAEEASEREMAALVREAVALSGLEGLGVPRVVRFGRLPGSGRPFMLRELVAGESLQELVERGDRDAFIALARAAEQLTVLHRAGLLHGDVKPANIIVAPDGRATLVDLGLAAPWQDSGAPAEGLTPKYAAPELLAGGPLTVRAEVYALGVALADATRATRRKLDSKIRGELDAVARRAIAEDPAARFPSADEFASALRRAAGLTGDQERLDDAPPWPVVGVENSSSQLLAAVDALAAGQALVIEGPAGSGRTTLLRRVAWSLGIEGHRLIWIDESLRDDPVAIQSELSTHGLEIGLTVLVDDADALDGDSLQALADLRDAGARIVSIGGAWLVGERRSFEVPPLERHAAVDLVRRAIPSLTGHLLERVIEQSRRRPGELRRLVQRIASEAVASDEDFERMLAEDEAAAMSSLPADALERAVFFLDRGRFTDARATLDAIESAESPSTLASLVRASTSGSAKRRLRSPGSRAHATWSSALETLEPRLSGLCTSRALTWASASTPARWSCSNLSSKRRAASALKRSPTRGWPCPSWDATTKRDRRWSVQSSRPSARHASRPSRSPRWGSPCSAQSISRRHAPRMNVVSPLPSAPARPGSSRRCSSTWRV